jgi:hypothetical protein
MARNAAGERHSGGSTRRKTAAVGAELWVPTQLAPMGAVFAGSPAVGAENPGLDALFRDQMNDPLRFSPRVAGGKLALAVDGHPPNSALSSPRAMATARKLNFSANCTASAPSRQSPEWHQTARARAAVAEAVKSGDARKICCETVFRETAGHVKRWPVPLEFRLLPTARFRSEPLSAARRAPYR